jgi:pimeloyl-ACP methyl ester carboxylesterase
MNRHSEIVTNEAVSIETYVDGDGPDVVVIPSYGRDGGADFDAFTAALVGAGYRALRPQPRGVGKSTGPMTGVVVDDLGDDIAHVIDQLARGPAAVLGHAFGNFVARTVATNHPERVAAVMLAAAAGRTVPPEINSAPMGRRRSSSSSPRSTRFITKTSGVTSAPSSDPASPQRSSPTPATRCSPSNPPQPPAR